MQEKIIQRGAEAVIFMAGKNAIKRRIKKSYRIHELDEKIRKFRTRSEAKLLEKASKIIPVPKVEKIDELKKEIVLDFVAGQKLSDNLGGFSREKQGEICVKIGESIAKLHDSDIIHGDLTTSNMILKNAEVYFIDFGLGFISRKIEDKAVDLHLLKEALEAKHFGNWKILFDDVLKGYKISKDFEKVLKQLEKVEKRGRYKERY
ncbi:Kae1-associated serine/threonine protein kinase [Candidatus Pacearchaeota archaeon]|nr:Kae1-associated serine/threonine protein kinase [Candidatus Pacearchaeota archaeon]